jgi:hypothetical protein
LDQLIDNIQVELVEYAELVIPIAKPTQPMVVPTKSSQLVQLVIELVQIENPQFSRFQLLLDFDHFIETLDRLIFV